METKTPSLGAVNLSCEKDAGNFTGEYAGFGRVTPPPPAHVDPDKKPREIPDVARRDLMFYLDRYCLGIFRHGKKWEWAVDLRRKFAKARGRNLKDLEDVFPEYQGWTQNFTFKLEPYQNTRRICIYPRHRREEVSNAEITRRLAGAIAAHLRGRKQACIDLTFLGVFQAHTGLEPNAIRHAWEQIFWIKGYRVRWNARRTCFYVSHGVKAHPETSRGISPLRGKDMKTSAEPTPEENSRSLREPPGEATETTPETPPHPSPNRLSASGEAGPGPREGGPGSGVNFQDRAARLPWQVGERWLIPKKNDKFARWLAYVPLQNMHATAPRVQFAGQTVEFAREATAQGFAGSEICAAYKAGLDASQAEACAHDGAPQLRMREGRQVWEHEPRHAGQAVNLAWQILRRDSRSDNERWAEIFARRPEARKAARGKPSPASPLRAKSSFRSYGGGLRVRAPAAETPRRAATTTVHLRDGSAIELEGKFPDTAPAAKKALEQPATIEAYLKHRGLALADMLRLSRAEQQQFVREMHAWQRPQKGG